MKLFESMRPVDFFRHANPHAARVACGEIFQRDDLVNDQVRFLASGAFVDRAANNHDGVGLDQFLIVDELIGPDDRNG